MQRAVLFTMSYIIRRLCSKNMIQLIGDNTNALILQRPPFLFPTASSNLQITRFKGKGDKNRIPQRVSETESDHETKDEDNIDEVKNKHTKTMKIHVPSMRVDTLLKAGLGISRNKLEVMFYESKIRVNGEKIPKKGINVREGDEIDVVKGVNIMNPDFLTVARVEILSAKGEDDSISVKIRRCKSLTIENYEGGNKWNQSQE